MKTKLLLLSLLGTSQLAFSQLSGEKLMGKMFADAGQVKAENATQAVLYGDLEKNKTVAKIDGSVNQYLLWFPVSGESVKEAGGGGVYNSGASYNVRMYVVSDNECFQPNAFYDQQYSLDESFGNLAKGDGYVQEEIDGDYLNGLISGLLNDCKWPQDEIKVTATLETSGKKGSTLVVSQTMLPVSSTRGSGLYAVYRQQVIDNWTSGSAANTVDDEALLSTVEKHLERNWGYDITTVSLGYLKYEGPKGFKFEGAFIAKNPEDGSCLTGDLFGTGGVAGNGSYFIHGGNNSMGFSPIDCDVAEEVRNR